MYLKAPVCCHGNEGDFEFFLDVSIFVTSLRIKVKVYFECDHVTIT
jgi:hypothetical protein